MPEHGHIGDGVYVSDDGHQLWLAVNNHNNKVVAMDPQVFEALLRITGEVWPASYLAEVFQTQVDHFRSLIPKETETWQGEGTCPTCGLWSEK